MTLKSTIDRTLQQCDGSTSKFTFDFAIHAPDDLNVYLIKNEQMQLLTLGQYYAMPGFDWLSGGYVQLNSHVPDKLTQIYMVREPALLQESSFRNLGSFFPEMHEDAFDRIYMILQGHDYLTRRALIHDDSGRWDFRCQQSKNVPRPKTSDSVANAAFVLEQIRAAQLQTLTTSPAYWDGVTTDDSTYFIEGADVSNDSAYRVFLDDVPLRPSIDYSIDVTERNPTLSTLTFKTELFPVGAKWWVVCFGRAVNVAKAPFYRYEKTLVQSSNKIAPAIKFDNAILFVGERHIPASTWSIDEVNNTILTDEVFPAGSVVTAYLNVRSDYIFGEEEIAKAKHWAEISKSWAVGPNDKTELEQPSDTNNAKYWAEQAKQVASGIESAATYKFSSVYIVGEDGETDIPTILAPAQVDVWIAGQYQYPDTGAYEVDQEVRKVVSSIPLLKGTAVCVAVYTTTDIAPFFQIKGRDTLVNVKNKSGVVGDIWLITDTGTLVNPDGSITNIIRNDALTWGVSNDYEPGWCYIGRITFDAEGEKVEHFAALSKGWAVGPSNDENLEKPTDENNAKHWSDQSKYSASEAKSAAGEVNKALEDVTVIVEGIEQDVEVVKKIGNEVSKIGLDVTEKAEQVSKDATSASQDSKTATSQAKSAESSAELSKRWAVGDSANADEQSDKNNAEFWSEQAKNYAHSWESSKIFKFSTVYTVEKDGETDIPTVMMPYQVDVWIAGQYQYPGTGAYEVDQEARKVISKTPLAKGTEVCVAVYGTTALTPFFQIRGRDSLDKITARIGVIGDIWISSNGGQLTNPNGSVIDIAENDAIAWTGNGDYPEGWTFVGRVSLSNEDFYTRAETEDLIAKKANNSDLLSIENHLKTLEAKSSEPQYVLLNADKTALSGSAKTSIYLNLSEDISTFSELVVMIDDSSASIASATGISSARILVSDFVNSKRDYVVANTIYASSSNYQVYVQCTYYQENKIKITYIVSGRTVTTHAVYGIKFN